LPLNPPQSPPAATARCPARRLCRGSTADHRWPQQGAKRAKGNRSDRPQIRTDRGRSEAAPRSFLPICGDLRATPLCRFPRIPRIPRFSSDDCSRGSTADHADHAETGSVDPQSTDPIRSTQKERRDRHPRGPLSSVLCRPSPSALFVPPRLIARLIRPQRHEGRRELPQKPNPIPLCVFALTAPARRETQRLEGSKAPRGVNVFPAVPRVSRIPRFASDDCSR